MLRIRFKMGPSTNRNKEWSCCFGLHVRTVTVMIGCWHLFLNVLALSFLAVIIRNPAMIHELENGYDDITVEQNDPPALPTPLSKIDPPFAYRDHSLNYQNIDMGGLVCLCMIAITLMMIYGAIKGRPSHLLPFFCLQLFDFAITTLTAAGYFCYLRSLHRVIADSTLSHRLPWREELLKLSPQSLSIVVLLIFIFIVLLKAYAIGIVWRCYKFLTLRQHNIRSMLPYIIPDARQERDYSSLLPGYDEAIAQSMKQAPPPSYQVAMSNSVPVANTQNILSGATRVALPPSDIDDDVNVTPTRSVSSDNASTSADNIESSIPPPAYNTVTVVDNHIGNSDTRISAGQN